MIVPIAGLLLQTVRVVGVGAAFPTIGAALRTAEPGDTVLVRPGVYREPTLVVDRSVVMRGLPGAVLDGEGRRELLVIRAAAVTVTGFVFRETGTSYHEDRAALHVDGATGCRIEGNRFERTFFAIYLARTDGCLVRDNVVVGEPGGEAGTGNAIHSWGSRHLRIEGNRLRGHRDGLYLEFTRHAVVRGNVSEAHLRYGLHFMYADSSTYEGNRFTANGSGVAVMYSRVIAMRDNRFERNRGATAYGLLLKEIADVRLERNRFVDNTTALLADGADRLDAVGNRFDGNGWALRLLASTSDGRFTENAFRGNAFDVTVNARHAAPHFARNWWDRYRGWDLDRDGLGDVPHRPVALLGVLVERGPAAMLLHRSLFARVLDAAERIAPILTPEGVLDATPGMRPPMERVR